MNAHQIAQAECAYLDRKLVAYEAQIAADEALEEEIERTVAELYADKAYIDALVEEITSTPEYEAMVADYIMGGRDGEADRNLADRIEAHVQVRAFALIRERQEKAKADYEAERAIERKNRK